MFIINGEVWRVKLVPAGHPALRRPDGSVSVGCCDDSRKTIFIDENIRGGFFIEVLGHEVTHAAMFSYNVSLTIEQEEIIADIISTYGEQIVYITNKVFNKLSNM